jgi:hypothetical protein
MVTLFVHEASTSRVLCWPNASPWHAGGSKAPKAQPPKLDISGSWKSSGEPGIFVQADAADGTGVLQYLSGPSKGLAFPLRALGRGELWRLTHPVTGAHLDVRAWRGGVRGVAGRLRLGRGKGAVDYKRGGSGKVTAPCKYVTSEGDTLAAISKLYAGVKGGDGKTAITVAGIQAENPYLRGTSGSKALRGGLPIRLPGCTARGPTL